MHTHFYGSKIFVFIICFNQIFMDPTKFGGHKKVWGELPPNTPIPPVAKGLHIMYLLLDVLTLDSTIVTNVLINISSLKLNNQFFLIQRYGV